MPEDLTELPPVGTRASVVVQTRRRPLPRVLALDDLEAPARRLLPRSVFGFISGGSETGSSVAANRRAFDDWAFCTRILIDIQQRSIGKSLFGRHYTAPFGIAPMGGVCMATIDGDLKLARAAAASGIPFVLSGASTVPLERIHAEVPAAWFQAYCPAGREAIARLVDRVGAAGFDVLVVTVDIPVPSNRENNVRSGFSFPIRFTPQVIGDALRHPKWLLSTGLPSLLSNRAHFENFEAERGAPLFRNPTGATARSSAMDWDDFAFIRERWPGRLIIKGILSGDDAGLARDAGADGLIVSNHGGRQLDHASATLRVLPDIVAAARGGLAIILDGGVRRGTDVLKALALGADFVLVGRPFLYAAALAGEAGVVQAIELLQAEIDRDMAMLGRTTPSEVDRSLLVPAARPSLS